MNTCSLCKQNNNNWNIQINEICKSCISNYHIINSENKKIKIKVINGYICYLSDNIHIPRCNIFINNIKCTPYLINNELIYLKN